MFASSLFKKKRKRKWGPRWRWCRRTLNSPLHEHTEIYAHIQREPFLQRDHWERLSCFRTTNAREELYREGWGTVGALQDGGNSLGASEPLLIFPFTSIGQVAALSRYSDLHARSLQCFSSHTTQSPLLLWTKGENRINRALPHTAGSNGLLNDPAHKATRPLFHF